MLIRSPTSLRVAVFGAGRVGTAVAHLLKQSGNTVAGVGPSGRESTSRAASLLGVEPFAANTLPEVDVLLVGVRDDDIRGVAAELGPRLAPGALVVHFAGALGTGPLDAVRAFTAHPAALHPVQSCPDVAVAIRRLPGSAWGVTCSAEARALAERVVADAGGRPYLVDEDDRVLWHAAAAIVANGSSALLIAGEAILSGIGIASPSAVLGPLASGTAANTVELGSAAAALTGPVARGDIATVERHLDVIEERLPALAHHYRGAARVILEAAVEARRMDAAAADAVRSTLDSSRGELR